MVIEERIPLVEEILGERNSEIGKDLTGYRNHVYRMLHFCFVQGEFTEPERKKLIIAGCFHDIGIWTAETFDYLPPSIAAAKDYLSGKGNSDWFPEISTMIDQHHKLRKLPRSSNSLAETFRKGDLVDFSLGIVSSGVSRDYIREVKQRFPNAGFHKRLASLAGGWICRHPLNPVPVLKW